MCRSETVPNKRHFRDFGFMGVTHALSVLGAALMIIAFAPDFVSKVLATNSSAILVMFVLASIGAGNLPDLDNTQSRAKNDLGPFGAVLSGIFRTTSTILQTTVRTKRDNPDPNPHRGAWHTIPAAVGLGLLVWFGTKIPGEVSVPFFGEMTWGAIFGVFIAFVLTHLTLSTLAKKSLDKIRKSNAVGELIAVFVSLITTLIILKFIPVGADFWWLGVAVAFGMTIHILGDCFTTAGAPVFFPLSALIWGKFWWTTRFLPIKAGGPFEKYAFVPLFTLMSIVGSIKIVIDMF